MSSNGTQVLSALIRNMHGLHEAAGALEGRLNKVKIAALGAVAAFAGTEALKGIWDMVEAGKELNAQLELLKVKFGLDVNIGQARKAALDTNINTPTSTPSDNVKVLGEVAGQLGELGQNGKVAFDGAAKLLPAVQQFGYVVARLTDKDGKHSDQSILDAIKFADTTGNLFKPDGKGGEAVDPDKFMAMMTVLEKMIATSGGLITTNSMLRFAQMAGVPIRMMTPDAIASMGEAIIAMGGAKAGTAETSLFQQFAGGHMTIGTAQELTRYGILPQGDWKADHGHVVVTPEGKERLGAKAADPEKLAGDIAETLQKAGKDRNQIMIELFALFGRQTVERLMAELVQNKPQIERFQRFFKAAPGVGESYEELQKNDLTTNLDSFHAAWTGLMQAIGEQGVPVAITIIHGLTDAIHWLAQASEKDAPLTKFLLEVAAGLAALVAVGGGMTVLGVALSGLVSPFKALGSAAALFAPGEAALGGLISIAPAFTAIAAAVTGFGAYKLGDYLQRKLLGDGTGVYPTSTGDPDSPANQAALRAGGPRVPVRPFIRPSASDVQRDDRDQPIKVIVMNGRTLARGVTEQQTRDASRAIGGPTGGDARSSPDWGMIGVTP